MNRDPFLRLALIALSSVYVLGLWLVGEWLGVGALVAVAVVGVMIASGLTVVLEREPSSERPVEDLRARRRQPVEGTAGFQRVE